MKNWLLGSILLSVFVSDSAADENEVQSEITPQHKLRFSCKLENPSIAEVVEYLRRDQQMAIGPLESEIFFDGELAQRFDGSFELQDATYWDAVKSLSESFNIVPVRHKDAFKISVADTPPLWSRKRCDFRGSFSDSRLLIQGELRAEEEKLVLGIWQTPGVISSEILIADVTMVRGDEIVRLDPGKNCLDATHQVWSWQYQLPANFQEPEDEDWHVQGTVWLLEVEAIHKVDAANPGSYQLGKLGRLDVGKLQHVRQAVVTQRDATLEFEEPTPMIQADFFPAACNFGGQWMSAVIFDVMIRPDEWPAFLQQTEEVKAVTVYLPPGYTAERRQKFRRTYVRHFEGEKMQIKLLQHDALESPVVIIAAYKASRLDFQLKAKTVWKE